MLKKVTEPKTEFEGVPPRSKQTLQFHYKRWEKLAGRSEIEYNNSIILQRIRKGCRYHEKDFASYHSDGAGLDDHSIFSVLLEQGSPFRASGAAGAVSARLEQSDASHGMVSCLKT